MTRMVQAKVTEVKRETKSPMQIAMAQVAKKVFHLVEIGGRCEAVTDFSYPAVLCCSTDARSEGVFAGKLVFDFHMDVKFLLVEPGVINCDGIVITEDILYKTLCQYTTYPDEFIYRDFVRRLIAKFPTMSLLRRDVTSFALVCVENGFTLVIDFNR